MIELDTAIVLGILALGVLAQPRVWLTIRFWRNGYPLRRAWRLAGDHE